MASAFSFEGFRSAFFFISRLYKCHSGPLFSVWMGATKEAGGRAQVPPVFPSGGVSVSALPTGDWSGGLSVSEPTLHTVRARETEPDSDGSHPPACHVSTPRYRPRSPILRAVTPGSGWRERCSPRTEGPAPRRCADNTGVRTAP